MPRLACSVALETYHGASTIILRILDLLLWIIDMLDLKQHIAKKRKQINITIKQLNWLLCRKSNLAIESKLLIYINDVQNSKSMRIISKTMLHIMFQVSEKKLCGSVVG
jgi:hypothetical protein